MKSFLGNRWIIILIATFFNLLFEYSLRGINNALSQPFLPLLLFFIYFTLFTMVEDLIVRFRLRDSQLMILSFFYGTIYCAWISGILFLPPVSIGGIRWIELLYVNLVWWGSLQAVLTFYLANLLSPREWNHSRLSKKGWAVCLMIQAMAFYLFQKSGLLPHGSPTGTFTILIILAVSLAIFLLTLKKENEIQPFQKSTFLNLLSILTILIFIVCAFFLTKDPILSATSQVNATSLRIVRLWTLILAILLWTYRFWSKKRISV